MNSYETPELTVYGSVEEMTLVMGGAANSDVPHGKSGTAYPSS